MKQNICTVKFLSFFLHMVMDMHEHYIFIWQEKHEEKCISTSNWNMQRNKYIFSDVEIQGGHSYIDTASTEFKSNLFLTRW